MFRVRMLSLAALLLLIVAAPVWAQESPMLPLAAINEDGQVVIAGPDQEPVSLAGLETFRRFDHLTWSPDGTLLAFVVQDDNGFHLMITDRAGSAPVRLVERVTPLMSISFTQDGQLVYTQGSGEMVDTGTGMGGEKLNVYTIAPQAGAIPMLLGSFVFGSGCGGGSSIPLHWRYWTETESGTSNSPLILELTPFGLLHSTNCRGVGTALLNLTTGTDTEIGTSLGWVAVSPNGAQAVGISKEWSHALAGSLMLVDLATLNVSTLVAVSDRVIDQVTWGAARSGAIFYSTQAETGQVIPTTPEEQQKFGEIIGTGGPDTFPVYAVTIHRFTLADNLDVQVYQGSAYAATRLTPLPDGSALIFSQIPNLERWIALVVDPTFDISTPEGGQQALAATAVELYSLNLADGSVTLIGTGLNRAAVNTAAG